VFATGCADTNLIAVTSGKFILEGDEKILWRQSEEEERRIDQSGLLYLDPELEAYLNEVPKKLLSPDVFARLPIKILVIRNYYLNAFAFPNGRIYIHTGLLARMENEAQLASLIAHEMTHITHRHSIKGYRDMKNATTFVAVLGGLAGGYGTLLGGLGAMASISGYSKELETEADVEGLKLIAAAGYDPDEAPKLFDHLKRYIEEEKIQEPFFFGTHPRLQERIANYERLLKTQSRKGDIQNVERFMEKIQRVIFDTATLDAKAGRFAGALSGFTKYLLRRPNDAQAYYLSGDVYRQRGEKGDTEKATALFKKSIEMNNTFPEPYKALGMMHLKNGDKVLAKENLQRYLLLSPEASDKTYIMNYLKTLE
jgi:predicted Zn-dependent protease